MDAAWHTVPGRLHHQAQRAAGRVAFLNRLDEGGWQSITWHDFYTQVQRLADNLAHLGIQAGDRVAIVLPTSLDWERCHQAALAIGAVVVGLDANDAPQNLHDALELTQPRLIVTTNEERLNTICKLWREPELAIVTTAGTMRCGIHALNDLLFANPAVTTRTSCEAKPDDLATIVFTSGSTGRPKGIAYSHRQLCLAVDGLMERFPAVRQDARLICWLPLSNLFQRVINLLSISCGATTHFVANPDDLLRLAPEIRPTLFVGVPRFFEKLHAAILSELDRRPAAIRALVLAAWKVGCRHATARRNGELPSLWCRLLFPAADRALSSVRARMGPSLQFMASGSAPMPRWLLERLHGLGWIVLEAYGISENVMPIAFNTLQQFRFGSVGKPLPGNELRFADDNELLVRGPGVFRGYYGDATSTDALDMEGFLRTGDYAHLDADGFLWLDGRKSEIFKTSTGRRIAPVPIEAALKTLDYVDHAVVVGRDRPYPIAVLTITPRHPVVAQVLDAATRAMIAADVVGACRDFPGYQRPGAILVSPRPLTVSGGELTTNQKVRRVSIERRFHTQIEEAYRRGAQSHPHRSNATPPVIEAP